MMIALLIFVHCFYVPIGATDQGEEQRLASYQSYLDASKNGTIEPQLKLLLPALLRNDGTQQPITLADVHPMAVAMFFCNFRKHIDDCRKMNDELKEAYGKLNKDSKNFEVIFVDVGSESDQKQQTVLQTMPNWLYTRLDQSGNSETFKICLLCKMLKKIYIWQQKGTPTVQVVSYTGAALGGLEFHGHLPIGKKGFVEHVRSKKEDFDQQLAELKTKDPSKYERVMAGESF